MTPFARPEPPAVSRDAWFALAVASLAVFAASIDTTVLFVAFPSIEKSFASASVDSLSWVLNAYTIGYGALLAPAGRLADRFGRRRFFLAGIAIFSLASALCGVAPDVGVMIAARALQAFGAAMLMPASLALVLDAFPPGRQGTAAGIWSAVGALAAAIGPAVGSAIVQLASWRWAFFLNIPVGVVALVLGTGRLRESRKEGAIPDLAGIALLIAALSCVAFGVVGVREHREAPIVLVVGLVLVALFTRRSLRVATPALDVRLLRIRTFAVANAVSFVFNVGFAALFFGNVLFLTEQWGLSVFRAGMWLTPGPLCAIPVAVLSGRIADRTGYRSFLVAGGLTIAAGGTYLLTMRGAQPSFWSVWLPSTLVTGAGIGMLIPSLSAAAALSIDSASLGVASGVNQAVRQFGSVFGVAIVVISLGVLAHGAPFQRVFATVIVSGLLTAAGGLLLPRATTGSSQA